MVKDLRMDPRRGDVKGPHRQGKIDAMTSSLIGVGVWRANSERCPMLEAVHDESDPNATSGSARAVPARQYKRIRKAIVSIVCNGIELSAGVPSRTRGRR